MICSLDYLVGTLATAYKGVITSLVAKDFCIGEADGVSHFRGTILAMPAGNYHASLIMGGVELARASVDEGGGFELAAGSAQAGQARDLQLDIIQNGRHIGTFLLKRGKKGGFYTPAIELSDEIGGVDFKVLTRPLEGRPGLLRKAEEIVYKALSAKKDWREFSDTLHGLAVDLFWQDRGLFYSSFDIFARFAVIAAKKTGAANLADPLSNLADPLSNLAARPRANVPDRPLANFLDLMELPLSKETGPDRLGGAAASWLKALEVHAPADLSRRLAQSVRVLAMMNERLPRADIKPAVLALFASLLERTRNAPVLSDKALDEIKDFVPPEDFASLRGYGSGAKEALLARLSEAGRPIESIEAGHPIEAPGDLLARAEIYKAFFREMGGPGLRLLDDTGIVEGFFGAAFKNKNLTPESAPAFTGGLLGLLSLLEDLSGRAGGAVVAGAVEFAERLMAAGRPDLCAGLLSKAAEGGAELQKEVVFNQAMASRIFASGDKALVTLYKDILKQIFIPPPAIRGYSPETWAERANPLHLELLSKFLGVLGAVPHLPQDRSENGLDDVKAHLICNLFLSGVFIPDDRLFQRRVSAYLNSAAMRGGFLLNYMLLKRLPVYFNEVGATSRIRDYTTMIDSWGNDPVLYFLRKQVHVNASNLNIRLAQGIIRAWAANEPAILEALVPADVFRNLDMKLLEVYHRIVKPLLAALDVMDGKGDIRFDRLLGIPEERLKETLEKIAGGDEARSKVLFLCRIYQETAGKYGLSGQSTGDRSIRGSMAVLGESIERLNACKAKILSPEKTEPRESLYFKRHIAFGIPSVLGTYHEEKFDSLSDFLRLGERARLHLEAIIAGIEADHQDRSGGTTAEDVSGEDHVPWAEAPGLAERVLAAHGLGNFQAEEFSAVIASGGLHPGQVLDVLRMWQKEIRWAVESFGRVFLSPLGQALKAANKETGLLPDYLMNLDPGEKDFAEKAADILIRNMITDIPGFTETDRLLSAVAGMISSYPEMETSGRQLTPETGMVMGKKAGGETADFYMLDELSDDRTMDLAALIGGKAKNLVYLRNRGFPVPAGAVFPSGHTWDYDEYARTGGLMAALRSAVSKLERRTGKVFGGADMPLFLSVRSGSYISMPGILVSILYCGMNAETIRGFIRETGNPLLAWDSYRIFLEHFGASVLGLKLKQGLFEDIKEGFMKKSGAGAWEALDAGRMEELTALYLDRIRGMGLIVPDDVYEQLELCVRAVYASWFSEKAAQFVRLTGMSPRWGTAVMLMQMVSGNSRGAGSSVFFTRNPVTLAEEIYGETKPNATGVELVSGGGTQTGASAPFPLKAGAGEGPGYFVRGLDKSDPELFRMHSGLARRIENALGGLPQEVEATYTAENGVRTIYVLQSRRMEFDVRFRQRFEAICRMESRVIGRGIGVHGGALSGVASFSSSLAAVRTLRMKTGLPVILLRRTASTEDVSLMTEVGGIIAAAGGATSHASVLAHKFNLTAIAGCRDLRFVPCGPQTAIHGETAGLCAMLGDTAIAEGQPISMDGQTGLIFSGICLETQKTG